jgi:bacillithiol biosynthesis cysteine-adding enzyme BshC
VRTEVRPGAGALASDPVAAALFQGVAGLPLPPLPREDVDFVEAASKARAAAVPFALGEALVERQRALGAGEKAEAGAAAIGRGALVVVAGQQPGLLGGPLYAVHKAAAAVALARRFERAGVDRVVPVFWVASEDHDWDEANRAVLQCRDGGHANLSLPVRGDLRSVRDVPVPREASDALLARAAQCLPDTERARHALARCTRPDGADLGAWFAATLARLLGEDAGLVFVEPHVLAPWAGPTYARLVAEAPGIEEGLEEGARRLAASGLRAPIEPEPGRVHVFLRDAPGGRRLRVGVDGDRVSLRGALASLSRAALVETVRARPELASGDVVGRVLVQNALLPVAAQVAGPAEIAYLAQVRPAHALLGVHFPVVVPRPRATWVEARVDRDLAALGLTSAAVLDGAEPPPAPPPSSPLGDEVGSIQRRLAGLAGEAEDPETKNVLSSLAEHADRAGRRLGEIDEQRRGLGRSRFERARASLLPRGRPQERVLSPVSIVARHGVERLREGLALLDPLEPGHRLLHLE